MFKRLLMAIIAVAMMGAMPAHFNPAPRFQVVVDGIPYIFLNGTGSLIYGSGCQGSSSSDSATSATCVDDFTDYTGQPINNLAIPLRDSDYEMPPADGTMRTIEHAVVRINGALFYTQMYSLNYDTAQSKWVSTLAQQAIGFPGAKRAGATVRMLSVHAKHETRIYRLGSNSATDADLAKAIKIRGLQSRVRVFYALPSEISGNSYSKNGKNIPLINADVDRSANVTIQSPTPTTTTLAAIFAQYN